MADKNTTMLDAPFANVLDEHGFDVTVETVIGRVTFGGKLDPLSAAFAIIAAHGKDGVYRFPGPHEDTTTVVTVEGVE